MVTFGKSPYFEMLQTALRVLRLWKMPGVVDGVFKCQSLAVDHMLFCRTKDLATN
jgi:hypothetical protein